MNTGTYCHVTDGVIDQGPCGLPVAWRNISGLNLMTNNAELKALGWLPVVDVSVEALPGQIVDGHTLEVGTTEVRLAVNARDLTADENQQITDSIKAAHNATILAQIAALDTKRIRPLAAAMEATLMGLTPDPADTTRLLDINADIDNLRSELQ